MTDIRFPFDVEKLFQKCKENDSLPRNDFKKQAVLLRLLDDFKDRIYSEEEIGGIIREHFSDAVLIRREFVNFGYMRRDPRAGEYQVVKRALTEEDIKNNTLLRRHAKELITR
ncbi:MAG: DUF2087 domain-containing protein [Nanoarchaeota archaeon]|nr:DUF2087 domain-containing protein [Nanoarchaeota archaeon]